jgi:putative SOS response-associated peptidase YedK
MCGRYVVTKPISKTEKIVKKVIGVVKNENNYNAHPQQKLPVIKQYVNGKTLEGLDWGLTPSWAKEKNIRPLINARLETLGEKISFKNLIKNYRCLVVADGYYEWKREKNIKTPHYFKRQDDEAIFFAAIFKTKQFCIVTREATSSVGDVHDRQPVIIDKQNLGHYLDLKNDGVDFLNSYKAPELKFHPVSKNVNVPTNNNENLILPK